jgi:lysophospholipid acyltransferase (LPLAT)-like uncharacterized protein
VDDTVPPLFRNTPLGAHSLKSRIIIHGATITFTGLIRVLGALTRFEVRGMEHFGAIERAGRKPIVVYWHDRIVLGTYFFRNRGLVSLISMSLDGEYITRVVRAFGFGAVRGSSSRGGKEALNALVAVMKSGHPTAVAIDGPRGPSCQAKIGPVVLAQRTGNPVLPILVEPRRCWNARSWDRLHIPCPFTSALVLIGEPMYVPIDADDRAIEAKRCELQGALDALVVRGREWRAAR